ncbi:MAG: TVP38/TMEM64 family protein [Bauldia sp.]|nr:TVP38/TMEM64 family protein [Bauldia sp.]
MRAAPDDHSAAGPTEAAGRTMRRRGAIIRGGLALAVIAAMVVAGFAFVPLFGDPEGIAAMVERAGGWGPVVFILIQALQVIAAPVPGQVTGLASGFLFGPALGILYCAIGGTIGCAVVFLLSRRLGRPFVEAFVSRTALQRFDYLADSGGAIVLLLIFLVPIFPDDIISYIAGLTRIPIHRLVLVAAFGRLPGYALMAIAGSHAAAADMSVVIAIAVVSVVLGGVLFWQRRRVEAFVRRLAQRGHKRAPAQIDGDRPLSPPDPAG